MESYQNEEDPIEIRVGKQGDITKIYQRAYLLERKQKIASGKPDKAAKAYLRTTVGRMIFSRVIECAK